MSACAGPISWDVLVEYWNGEMKATDEAAVEEHLMGCAPCTAESGRVAAVTETLRSAIPPILSLDGLARLRERGVRVLENHMAPGERKEVVFPSGVDLLLHCLDGLDLDDATQVDFTLHDEATGNLMAEVDDVPFDRARGTVLLACQRHFSSMPPDTIAEVTITGPARPPRVARYTILHRFP